MHDELASPDIYIYIVDIAIINVIENHMIHDEDIQKIKSKQTKTTQDRKLKDKQHGPYQRFGMNSCAFGGQAVPASHKTHAMLFM